MDCIYIALLCYIDYLKHFTLPANINPFTHMHTLMAGASIQSATWMEEILGQFEVQYTAQRH